MCSPIPKALWVVLVNLANDRPSCPGFVSWGRRAQNLDNLLFSLVPVGNVGFDVVRAVFNDGSMTGVELGVFRLPFCERLVEVVHFLEAGHIHSKILENCGSVTEYGVCREESLVKWEVDSDGVGGVTRCEEELDEGEICVCGVTLVGSHWQFAVVCEVMPGGTRRGSGVIFHRNGFDVVVQGQVLGPEWEFPKSGRFERLRGGGIPFGPPFPDEGQDATDPLVMVDMPMCDDDFGDVWKFWVGYYNRFLEGRFEDGDVVVPPLPSIH